MENKTSIIRLKRESR